MKDTINTYFAVLIITLAGSAATLLIVQVATSDAVASSFSVSEAAYESLQ